MAVVVSLSDAATWLLLRWPSASRGRLATIQLSLRSARAAISRRSGAPMTSAQVGYASTTPNMSMAGGFGSSAPTSAYSDGYMSGPTVEACSTASLHLERRVCSDYAERHSSEAARDCRNRAIAEPFHPDLSLATAIDTHFQAEESAKDVVVKS